MDYGLISAEMGSNKSKLSREEYANLNSSSDTKTSDNEGVLQ